jgi:hypothetical protein
MLLLSVFPFQPLSHLKRWKDVVGRAHVLFFYQTGALFLHKQPHNLCNNKLESFSVRSFLRLSILIRHLSLSGSSTTTPCTSQMTFIRMIMRITQAVIANGLPTAEGKSEV